MLKHYLLVALRSLRRQKGYAFINVAGLAVGLAFCVLIGLYVRDELTFDRFHEQSDRIVRVTQFHYAPDGSVEEAHPYVPMPLGPALEADLPEVERAVRLMEQDAFVRRGETALPEKVLFADPGFFDVFTFPLVEGDPATALADPGGIVLSEVAARAWFGDEDPMGKGLQVRLGDAYYEATVTGVAAPVPGNSSVRFDYLMSFAKLPEAFEWIRNNTDRWNASSFFTFALLAEGASPGAAAARLPAFRAKYLPDETARLREEGQWTGEGPARGYGFQPLEAVHLDPSIQGGLVPPSAPTYSYILAAIALAILLIACINFTTLAIGRSAGRAKEIGVRKVVGAQRRQLLFQFWGEALLMSALALVAGLVLAELALPTFNTLAGKDLRLDYLADVRLAAGLLGLTLLVGLVAGSYPALLLSGLRPIETLRQHLRLGGSGALTRSLVVVQFALSVFLLCSTGVMLRQLHYLQTKDLGFNQTGVVVIPTQGEDGAVLLSRLRAALSGRPDVLGVTGMSSAFAHGWSLDGWNDGDEAKEAYVYRVEPGFLDVMQMPLVAGRDFDPAMGTDSTGAVLVNEAFVRDFGWAEPIGQTLDGFYDEPTVVGVVRDVHFLSLHEAVAPMVLMVNTPDWNLYDLLVRLAPGDVPGALRAVEAAWAQAAPDVPFQYTFLDDDLGRQYESEQRWSRIVGYAAGFAVLIACLGLFGLASLSVARRTKEVGIRKALGASVTSVTLLLSKEFARLVLVAVVVATPLAWLAVERWLETFAYRADLGPGVFLLAGGLALAVALLTVALHTARAAAADPVQALRYE
jgi:putative ABC transport system permease protein